MPYLHSLTQKTKKKKKKKKKQTKKQTKTKNYQFTKPFLSRLLLLLQF